MYKKILTVFMLFLLTGCGGEKKSNQEAAEPVDNEIEEIEKEQEEESFKEATGDFDLEEEELEDIPWDEIHLTKTQFDEFLDGMLDDTFEVDNETEEDQENLELDIKNIRFDEQTIEYTLSSIDEDDLGASFGQVMFISIIDSYTRQFYLHSDYSKDDKHPTIIFIEEDGTVITENDDFIEFEE